MFANAHRIPLHSAVLKAFLISSVITAQYCLVPPSQIRPAIAFLAILHISDIASIVLLPFLKPYCRELSPLGPSVNCSILLQSICSSTFPAVLIMHRGRYDDGFPGLFSDLGRRTSLCCFQLGPLWDSILYVYSFTVCIIDFYFIFSIF